MNRIEQLKEALGSSRVEEWLLEAKESNGIEFHSTLLIVMIDRFWNEVWKSRSLLFHLFQSHAFLHSHSHLLSNSLMIYSRRNSWTNIKW
jgi:hypothetical protein